MSTSEYFSDIPTGQLTRGYYARVAVYACNDCGALVTEEGRDKHTTQHELRAALLKQLGNASHSHGVIA